jgi:hypothetical protein
MLFRGLIWSLFFTMRYTSFRSRRKGALERRCEPARSITTRPKNITSCGSKTSLPKARPLEAGIKSSAK